MREFARPAAALMFASLQLVMTGHGIAGSASSEITFSPHRAVYDLKLDGSSTGSGVADVTGRIVYELTGSSCEGYAQSMRFVTQTTTQEGETQLTDFRSSSWEAVPARRMRFSSMNVQNEQPTERTQGAAAREQLAGPVTVELARPAQRTIELARDVYFPIQHSMALITAAREGKRILAVDLFDGSETGDKVYATSSVIGRLVVPGAKKTLALLKDGDKLDRVPSWPVSVSYFKQGAEKGDATPLYEMSFRIHDNGVTSSLRIDHGEFAIRGDLKELVYLEVSKCASAKP